MKKILKKIVLIFIIILIVISVQIKSLSMQNNTNQNEKTNEYKSRSFTLKGFEDITFLMNDKIFFNGENNQISVEQKELNNRLTIIMSIILIIYWIVLLIIFEKEETYNYTYENADDIETLKKYNPLIAGCIADNRQALPRDIIAVVLNLIKKGHINMKMVPNAKGGKENYNYIISENKKKVDALDKIESFVLSWIFGFYEETEVDLIKKIKELAKRKDFSKKMNELENITEEELYKKGANIPRVPKKLRIFNIILLIFTIILSVIHIINNGLSIQIYQSTIWLLLVILLIIFIIIPVIAAIIHLILLCVILLKKFIKSTTERFSGKKIVQTSALILVFMILLIGIMYLIAPNKYICLDIFMMGMAILIVKTDNLMTKHSSEILNDYYALNEIKYRIEEYSLIKDEQINYIKLWDEYLIYAVAFGIPIPIVNKLQSSHKENEDIAYLLKCESLYYICKAYFEVMWDMNFKKGTKLINLDNIFGEDTVKEPDNWHKFA